MERAFWQGVYDAGDTRFDLHGPSAPLCDWLDEAKLAPGRAIVPGCGFGHEVVELARRGWHALGVDFVQDAVLAGERSAQEQGVQDRAAFLASDIFALGDEHGGAYDLLFEQTCYCAIDPARRDDYVALAARLVRPGGLLAFVVFPLDAREGGPPFRIGQEEVKLRFESHFELVFERTMQRPSSPRRAGKEKLALLRRRQG